MPKKYELNEDQKKEFAGVYLLEYMVNENYAPPIFLQGNEQDLETVLEWLLARDLIEIQNEEQYVPSQKGKARLKKFRGRYSEYLTYYDIFCAVDLEAGEFAFEYWHDYSDDSSFREFINGERWDDLRVAVADYKGINPVEIVFMSFINEKRFGRDASGWQFDLLLGTVWDQILNICESAIQWEELGYEDEQGLVPAEDVINDIIVSGTEIMLDLLGEKRYAGNGDTAGDADYDPERMDEGDYKKYLDPKYISPNWKN